MFPEKRKLLSEDQYYQEGMRHTRKSLKELQNYCSSPECNPWKTVLRLKDPIRLYNFDYIHSLTSIQMSMYTFNIAIYIGSKSFY